jgi:CRP/FNR family transcriptional regulator, cyclic AMP receptor protein
VTVACVGVRVRAAVKKVLYMFAHLEDTDVDWIAANGKSERVARGRAVIEEGSELDSVFFLLQGSLTVSTRGAGAVSTLEWGEILGEMSLVDGRPASATVSASQDSQVLRLGRTKLEEHLQRNTGFAARFHRGIAVTLSERLRSQLTKLDPRAQGGAGDELSFGLLENVHLAGARFDRLLKTSLGK